MRLNFSVFILLIVTFFLIFFKTLYTTAGDIQDDVVSRFELSNQAIEAQINYLELHTAELNNSSAEYIRSLLNLKKFADINFITIQLFDGDDNLLLSNNYATVSTELWWFERIEHVFIFGLFEPIDSKVHSIDIAQQHQGKLIVSVDIAAKLRMLWSKTLTAVSPLALIFVVAWLVIALMIRFIIKPLSDFLHAVTHGSSGNESTATKFALLSYITDLPKRLQGIRHELEDSSKTVHDLNNRILHLQEDERRRLSAELHDELGQHLTAIRFEAEVIKTAKTLEDAQQSAEAIDSIGRDMKNIVRSMLQRLRPPELDLFGLQATITEMVADWELSHPQCKINYLCQADFSQLDEATQLNIYRIVQEGLTNISRHAGLTGLNITISLLSSDDQIHILILDDGQGCDLTQRTSGFGLNGMRERVESCSGTISLESSPNQGMKIEVVIPTKREHIDE